MKPAANDVIGVLGLAGIGAGLWMWWPPAALMVVGALLLAIAVASAVIRAQPADEREGRER